MKKQHTEIQQYVSTDIDPKLLYRHSFWTRWPLRLIYLSRLSVVAIPVLIVFGVLMAVVYQLAIDQVIVTVVFIGFLIGGFAFLIFCVSEVALFFGKRMLSSRILRCRGKICPNCFYDLSARPRNDDTCPECGMIAPRRECVRLWCKLLRSRF